MEYLWCVIASIGAGVGTGLVGLSAATVIVPILIVLCPSFREVNGVYQATAIALASDILGSALASYIYAKNKNIDLKKGSILLICIVSMSIVGSIVASLVGDVVLGTSTLFLTLLVGIRFLINPDSNSKNDNESQEKISGKELLIALFFGSLIGFTAGFVGSGGGMTMLVLFTVGLKMDRKKAVGTSTFIMIFTALIASISHIVIEPSIVLEKWDFLLIGIIVTTIASYMSAQFANKVNNRIVGLTTGMVLTILGAFLLLLHYGII